MALREDGTALVTWTWRGNRLLRAGRDARGQLRARETVGTDGFPHASFTPDGHPRVQYLTGNQSALKLHTAVR